jgi:hypothetical protein
MRQPFYQARLVNKLDAAATFARVEQWLLQCSFTATNPTCIWFLEIPFLPLVVRRKSRIVHQVWESCVARILAGLLLRKIHALNSVVSGVYPTILRMGCNLS